MRLYLNADSKNGISYTPDTLIIENGNKRYEYDIRGTTDYSLDGGLRTRSKGELFIRDDKLDDYRELKIKDEITLYRLLMDKNSVIIVAIYPVSQYEQETEKINTDELTECYGSLELHNCGVVGFKFYTEFYGI